MAESEIHKRSKKQAAGRGGKTEVPLKGKKRLDALTKGGGRATEIELSSTKEEIRNAVERLKESGAKQKVLRVNQKNMDVAIDAMKNADISGTVTNIKGSKKRHVRKSKK